MARQRGKGPKKLEYPMIPIPEQRSNLQQWGFLHSLVLDRRQLTGPESWLTTSLSRGVGWTATSVSNHVGSTSSNHWVCRSETVK